MVTKAQTKAFFPGLTDAQIEKVLDDLDDRSPKYKSVNPLVPRRNTVQDWSEHILEEYSTSAVNFIDRKAKKDNPTRF